MLEPPMRAETEDRRRARAQRGPDTQAENGKEPVLNRRHPARDIPDLALENGDMLALLGVQDRHTPLCPHPGAEEGQEEGDSNSRGAEGFPEVIEIKCGESTVHGVFAPSVTSTNGTTSRNSRAASTLRARESVGHSFTSRKAFLRRWKSASV